MSIPFEVNLPSTSTPSSPQAKSNNPVEPPPEQVPTVWSVSKLTRALRMTIEQRFSSLVLEGELSNIRFSPQGHLYLTLKDEKSQIKGVMFRGAAQRVPFEPKDGLMVVVRGHISIYEPRGEYQIQISSMEPKGVGALQLAFDQLKEKLYREGLFNTEYKKRIAFLPRRIGVVTSPTSAAFQDMLKVLSHRFPGIPVTIFPALVQGPQAPKDLIEGLQFFQSVPLDPPVDTIIIGRGGGSMEDLWGFNDEQLARAIFACSIPVISAVGHEVDFTIADFVADLRAPTPSAAMEHAVPKQRDLLHTVQQLSKRMFDLMQLRISEKKQRLEWIRHQLSSPEFTVRQHIQRTDELSTTLKTQMKQSLERKQSQVSHLHEKLLLLNPQKRYEEHHMKLDALTRILQQMMQHYLESLNSTLEQQAASLDLLSPLKLMNRGYSVVLSSEKRAVKSAKKLKPQDKIYVKMQDGTVKASVEETF